MSCCFFFRFCPLSTFLFVRPFYCYLFSLLYFVLNRLSYAFVVCVFVLMIGVRCLSAQVQSNSFCFGQYMEATVFCILLSPSRQKSTKHKREKKIKKAFFFFFFFVDVDVVCVALNSFANELRCWGGIVTLKPPTPSAQFTRCLREAKKRPKAAIL